MADQETSFVVTAAEVFRAAMKLGKGNGQRMRKLASARITAAAGRSRDDRRAKVSPSQVSLSDAEREVEIRELIQAQSAAHVELAV
ncbi:hypothetical protein BP5796_04621 [Coleophoma crateriformis]|uniref:Uncharacterized protein n=1 Tax=Coleophoma crateriformis TaxID=565419 RepID=A0A3D8SA36_9HELO|nr:hypothetical protein BP5796_04621 [Coleophoma crateriformis]